MLSVASSIQQTLTQSPSLLDRLTRSEQEVCELQARNRQLTERNTLLEEEVRWLKGQLFGRSSQKSVAEAVSPDQKLLFNEAEVLAAIAAADAAHAQRTTTVAAHERRARPHSGGRERIGEHLPRQEIAHDLPSEQKWCVHESVCWAMHRIGEEVSERYHYEPPKLWVERHVRPKYSCPHCHEGVRIAPVPEQILPKSNASASVLAHLVCSKFVDHLPLYRVCRQLERQEVFLSPGTVGSWVNELGAEKVLPLIHLMHEELLEAPLIQMDETYLQVLKSEKAASSDHYMVVRGAGPPGRRIILFNYEPSRTTEALKRLLIGPAGPYRGKLLSDGLELYDAVAEALKLEHFGCLQHCRTYYHKAVKVSELPSGRSLARVALEEYIAPIYAVERALKELREQRERARQSLSLQEILKARQEKSAPVMVAFKKWVDDLLPGTPPTSALGKALAYTASQWSKLSRFLEHPEVPVDNNYLENQIRPFAIGRRGWLFAHNPFGARASANLYSLVATARVNGLEPYAYLRRLFEKLPETRTAEALEQLLPWNFKRAPVNATAAHDATIAA